jgi:hypothetical protein
MNSLLQAASEHTGTGSVNLPSGVPSSPTTGAGVPSFATSLPSVSTGAAKPVDHIVIQQQPGADTLSSWTWNTAFNTAQHQAPALSGLHGQHSAFQAYVPQAVGGHNTSTSVLDTSRRPSTGRNYIPPQAPAYTTASLNPTAATYPNYNEASGTQSVFAADASMRSDPPLRKERSNVDMNAYRHQHHRSEHLQGSASGNSHPPIQRSASVGDISASTNNNNSQSTSNQLFVQRPHHSHRDSVSSVASSSFSGNQSCQSSYVSSSPPRGRPALSLYTDDSTLATGWGASQSTVSTTSTTQQQPSLVFSAAPTQYTADTASLGQFDSYRDTLHPDSALDDSKLSFSRHFQDFNSLSPGGISPGGTSSGADSRAPSPFSASPYSEASGHTQQGDYISPLDETMPLALYQQARSSQGLGISGQTTPQRPSTGYNLQRSPISADVQQIPQEDMYLANFSSVSLRDGQRSRRPSQSSMNGASQNSNLQNWTRNPPKPESEADTHALLK